MNIKNIKFVKSLSNINQYNDSEKLPEIAIVGRSNVGKSSIINMLAGNKKLAKTSATPGRTRLINLFQVDDEFMLVDLPGYGYAKASADEQNKWAAMIEEYLHTSEQLKAVILLVDIRHAPSEKDKQMLEWLVHFNVPVIIVATKVDKIKKSELPKCKQVLARDLKVGVDNIIVTSAQTGVGKNAVLSSISQILGK